MNWRRFYATIQVGAVVGGVALGGAGCWAFIIAGLFRIVFHLDENKSMALIALPLFIGLLIWFIRLLPRHLRKTGILSDDPKRFGPWLKRKAG
jgi:hypothetical protein